MHRAPGRDGVPSIQLEHHDGEDGALVRPLLAMSGEAGDRAPDHAGLHDAEDEPPQAAGRHQFAPYVVPEEARPQRDRQGNEAEAEDKINQFVENYLKKADWKKTTNHEMITSTSGRRRRSARECPHTYEKYLNPLTKNEGTTAARTYRPSRGVSFACRGSASSAPTEMSIAAPTRSH